MTKKINENLTRSEAVSLAWKNRKSYKGYDRSKGGSYNSWRSIIYTAKGNRIGYPVSWRAYKNFLSDINGEWAKGKIVCRFDINAPHSKDNSFWNDKGFENTGKLIAIEYLGKTQTLVEWSNELNLNYQGIRQRFFRSKGLTSKEILFGRERKIKTPREMSADFRSARMFGAYRLRDKRKNRLNDLSLDYFRDEIRKPCLYCGDIENIGLDRIDNNKGHEKANVVPCCYSCNCARMNNFSFDEMKLIGLAIKEVKRIRNENR